MNKSILLSEDLPDDARAFTRVLRSAGILNPITEVRTGAETISYLNGDGAFADREEHPFPVVLFLDLLMPNGDGWTVLRWLRAHPAKSRLLVIVLTGAPQRDSLNEAYLAGATSFLVKPFTKADLDGMVLTWPHVWKLAPNDPRAPRTEENGQKSKSRV
jgi:CheY-like chemotaxis protein